MSKLSEALAAKDKGTPGEWVAHISTTDTPKEHTESAEILTKIDGLVWKIATMNPKEKARHNAILIAAAPGALAWIKEALPLMEKLIEPIDEYLGTVAGGDVNYFHEQLDLYEKTKALIARAKPEV